MKSASYKENVKQQIDKEKDRNQRLLSRVSQLEKQIRVLIADSVELLKVRMNELGINTTSQNDLLCKAKEIVGRHKELQIMAAKLQKQVNEIEQEQNKLVMAQVQTLTSKTVKTEFDPDEAAEITAVTSHELILKEIANTLSQRKKLQTQISSLESDLNTFDKSAEVNLCNGNIDDKKSIIPIKSPPAIPTTSSASVTTTPIIVNSTAPVTISSVPTQPSNFNTNNSKSSNTSSKSQRKNREHRTRSQEWPDIPDVGKIEENNPEILAQKILETGRQIEAGKLISYNKHNKNNNANEPDKKQYLSNNTHSGYGGDSALMPAPQLVNNKSHHRNTSNTNNNTNSSQVHNSFSTKNYSAIILANPTAGSKVNNVSNNNNNSSNTPGAKIQDSHKVVNFEDRLKSIITSVLQGHEQPKVNNTVTETNPTKQQKNVVKSMYLGNNFSNTNSIVNNSSSPGLTNQLNSVTTITASSESPTGGYNKNNQHSSTNNSKMQTNSNYPGVSANVQSHYSKNLSVNVSPSEHQSESSPSSLLFQQHALLQHQQHGIKGEFKAPDKFRNLERQMLSCSDLSSNQIPRSSSAEAEFYGGSNSSDGRSYTITNQQPHSRPGSSSSQPDYTQVSPAKMALRRHLSQEKLSQQVMPSATSKTIGDLVNGEIERTLEISNQSIINAAVNMSTMLTGGAVPIPPNTVINTNVARPERVSVRVLDQDGETTSQLTPSVVSPAAHVHGQNSLATLAHVASYNQKTNNIHPLSHHSRTNSSTNSSVKSSKMYCNNSSRNSGYQNHLTDDNMRGSGNTRDGQYHNRQASFKSSKSGDTQSHPYIALPRTEMKPYLESYFTEDHKPPANLTITNTTTPNINKQTSINEDRLPRMNGGAPLEGK